MTFQAGWNAFMWPMIVLNADEMKTVQVGLAAFQYNYNTNYGPLMAGTILATLPVLVLFILHNEIMYKAWQMPVSNKTKE